MTFDHDPRPNPGQFIEPGQLSVGQDVLYRGRKARILRIAESITPGGQRVGLVRLQFPRGGEQTAFAAQLQPVPVVKACDYCDEGLPISVDPETGIRWHFRVHDEGTDRMPCTR